MHYADYSRSNDTTMRTPQYDDEPMPALLRERQVATLPELKAALGTDATMTVFRRLRARGYAGSYTHRGKYYALSESLRFDILGLWHCAGVYFSQHGTLAATAEFVVGKSEAGYTARELSGTLHADCRNVLRQAFLAGRLSRRRVGGVYVYFCAVPTAGDKQLRQRRELIVSERRIESFGEGRPGKCGSTELRQAAACFVGVLNEQQRRLFAGLESLRVGRGGDRRAAELVGVDVHTVARGRRELLSGDVMVTRVRRPGGGRKPAGH